MSWIFALAFVVLVLSILSFTSAASFITEGAEAGLVTTAMTCGIVLILVAAALHHGAVMGEVNCYRDGGSMIDTQCMVVKGAVNGND